MTHIGDSHPKAGDVVGDRTVIRVCARFILYGQREGDVPNCGSYVTSYATVA